VIAPLAATFLVVTLVEIWIILQVGHVIGAWWTLVALVAESVIGAWVVRREGRRAWRNLIAELSTGRVPTKQAADGAAVLVGGVLLITPGFLTDAAGFLCVLPLTRPVVRRLLVGLLARRTAGLGGTVLIGAPQGGTRRSPATGPDVIDGRLADPPGSGDGGDRR
jgi:UPF0716 protein FxsA